MGIITSQITITGSLFTSASISNLPIASSLTNIIVYNSGSGQLTYTSSAAIGGSTLKKINVTLNAAEIADLHNTSVPIGSISADAKIISIKCFTNQTISGYDLLQIFEVESNLTVANLFIGNLANNYNYYFSIGDPRGGGQLGFNIKQPTGSLSIIAVDPIIGAATAFTIEVYYFE